MNSIRVKHDGLVSAFRIVTPSGSAGESIPGLAHFAEHMAFKGTERLSLQEFNARSARLGEFNAYTAESCVVYHCASLAEDAAEAAELLASMVTEATFPEDEIERERGVILEELASWRSSPGHAFWLAADPHFYGDSFGHFGVGTEESVKAITRDDLIEWRDQQLSRLRIIAAGPEPLHSLRGANLQTDDDVGANRVTPEWNVGELQFSHPTPQAHVALLVPGQPYWKELASDLALDVACDVLGGGTHSPLWNRLREELGICYSIHCWHSGCAQHGYAGIKSPLAVENIERWIEETEKVLDEAVRCVPSEWIDISRRRVAFDYARSRRTAEQCAREYDSLPFDVVALPPLRKRCARILALDDSKVQEWITRLWGGRRKTVVMRPDLQGAQSDLAS